MNSANFTMNDFFHWHRKVQEGMDKASNPNGSENHVIRLDNMLPGEIIIMRQFLPNCKPIEVGRMLFKENQNRLSLDKEFKGIVIGTPKDTTKKFEIVYVGFTDEEIKKFNDIEQTVNRIKSEQK